jgi:penicillin V acylase-like amidase (Ntn superfamily)
MTKLNRILIIVIIVLSFYGYNFACTGFSIKNDNRIVACFNFDFQFGAGHIYINKRNVERRRYLLYAESPIQWISKYGSITFNIAGVNLPHDGMNEAGLVVLSMGLDDTKFPNPDNRYAIDENGWIQYQLDNSANIDEVIKNMKNIRISSRSIGDSHFLIVDSTGNSLIIEYINEEEKIYTGKNLPFPLLANDTYSNMLTYLKQQKEFGGLKEDKFRVGSSCSRFTYIAKRLREYNPSSESELDFAFGILNDVKQSNTQYQVIYDIANRSINYKSHNSNDVKRIRFDEINFDCDMPILMTDIQSSFIGDIKKDFLEYDPQRCKKELIEFNKKTFEYLPNDVLFEIADSPTRSKCINNGLKASDKNNINMSDLTASLKQPKEKIK